MHVASEYTQAYQEALIESGAVRIADNASGLCTLRNGDPSWIYVDHGRLLCHPETFNPYLKMLGNYLLRTYPAKESVLVNVDSKSSPHTVGALAALHGYRQIVVNPEITSRNEGGVNLRLRKPRLLGNERLVVVDDVMTQKDITAINVARLLRQEQKPLATDTEIALVVGLVRGNTDEIEQELSLAGIQLSYFLDIREVIDHRLPTLTPVQRLGVEAEFGT